jgi:hypothetical protein
MTWPAGAVNTTNVDAGTDNPQNARADILDAFQKLNQIIAHISSYIQGLLDDTDAATARATLGAAPLASPTFTGLVTTDGQVAFPATQNPSADPNTIDDYEEGLWTPSLGGTATYLVQSGRYTKIGRMVHVEMNLTVNSLGTGSATSISGLPFAPGQASGLTVDDFASIATSIVWLSARIASGATTIGLRSLTAAGTTMGNSAIFANGATLNLSGSYSV